MREQEKDKQARGRWIEDPNHPAMQGRYAKGEAHRINYYREGRKPWEAVEIFLTLRCPIACYHCITNSHPGRQEVMEKNLLMAIIRELARLGATRYVCLFGGEPVLEMDLLEAGIAACREHHMLPSVHTSGYWAEPLENARGVARRLRGVNHFLLSASRAHQEFVNPGIVIQAAEACVAEGINTSINYVAEADEFAGSEVPEDLLRAARRIGVGIVVTPCSDGGLASARPEIVAALPPNSPCAKLDVPLFDCEGNAYACGPGWTIPAEGDSRWLLGRFPDQPLEQLFHRCYESPVLDCIRREGPLAAARRMAEQRAEWAADLESAAPQSPCGACQWMARRFSAGVRFAEEWGASTG